MQDFGRHILSISSTLTRPADTTAYAQNDLIASATSAGSVVVPGIVMPVDVAEGFMIRRARLLTNLTTGFTTFSGIIDLWSAAPTFTNGDNGAYAVATGAANWLGRLTTDVVGTYGQMADGAAVMAYPGSTYSAANQPVQWARGRGDKIYWSLRELDSTGFTPISGQTFTLVLDGEAA